MLDGRSVPVRELRLVDLQPYVSLLVLWIDATADPSRAFDALVKRAHERRAVAGAEVSVVATGLDAAAVARTGADFDQVTATVWQRRRAASWATAGSSFVDVEHQLMICLRRGRLLALTGPDQVRSAVLRWVDSQPRPPVRRLPAGVLNAAFLGKGESKTMWLRNVRGRTASRPSAKTLTGVDLGAALDPIGDASFALSAARVELPDDDRRRVFTGTVGTAPRSSRVWGRQARDAVEFLIAVDEALGVLQTTVDVGDEVTNPYGLLCLQVDGIEGVRGGFEFGWPQLADLEDAAVTPERVEAVRALERVTVTTEPVPGSADVLLDVGFDGCSAGRLRVSVRTDRDRVRLAIGNHGDGTDPVAVSAIRDALRGAGDWSIHYMSGHAIFDGAVYQVRRETAPFEGWGFEDFSGYRVDREKPPGSTPEKIHAAIGRAGDDSLFAWVANTYRRGVLLCDDGPGEVADFLHLDDDGTLSFIHVKAAGTRSPRRQIAVAHYEVVVGQAVKNLVNLDRARLQDRLNRSPIRVPAAWHQGVRVTGRQEFLDSLACWEPTDPVEVVVVQPHVTGARLHALRAMPANTPDADLHRLRLLDTLLNSAMWSCRGSNARFRVVVAA